MIRILGIDPGSQNTGYGIIDMEGNHSTHVTHGIIKLQQDTLSDKLLHIFETLSGIIDKYQPAEASIERVFIQCDLTRLDVLLELLDS